MRQAEALCAVREVRRLITGAPAMNFKFTPKTMAIVIAGIALAGVVATAFDSPASGLAILFGVVAWLWQNEKNQKR